MWSTFCDCVGVCFDIAVTVSSSVLTSTVEVFNAAAEVVHAGSVLTEFVIAEVLGEESAEWYSWITTPNVALPIVKFVGKLGQDKLQYVRSMFMAQTMSTTNLASATVRNTFDNLVLTESRPVNGHTHPLSAADRSAVSSSAERLADQLGLTPYFPSKSEADDRHHRLGSRSFYWSKDINAKPAPLILPDNPLVVLIDVDYYMDMPKFLSRNVYPTLIYAFQPEHVVKNSGEISYLFTRDNKVHYRVTGGSEYTHEVWNYSKDIITASSVWGTAVYNVNRRTTQADHEIIMLTPKAHWQFPANLFARLWMEHSYLERLKVNHGKFNRLRIHRNGGVKVATARVGSYCAAILPAEQDDALAAKARSSKYPLTIPDCQKYVGSDQVAALALLEYHLEGNDTKPDFICPVEQSTLRYQFEPARYDSSAKPMMSPFMRPLVNNALIPDRTEANERRAVEGRVEQVRNKVLRCEPFVMATMHEFAELFIPEDMKHQFQPVDYDTVRDRQFRPSQRSILARSEGINPKRVLQTFIKTESYLKPADPRIISQYNGCDKRDYSMYIYGMEELMKTSKWYAFCRHPLDIAHRVVEVVKGAQFCVNTDFSRFDGHVSNILRDLERIILLRIFSIEHHQRILELHKHQFGLVAYAPFGTKYFQGYARGSGSPDTSIFNSLSNAYIAFLALRMSTIDGKYIQSVEAYDRLGIYGGDDGLTANVNPDTYVLAAKKVGQVLTVEPVICGSIGVKFLARVYSPKVWDGDPTSCCDIKRQLSKLHISVAMPSNVTPVMKLMEKARSFLLSDRGTPILGMWALTVSQFVQGDIKVDMRTERMQTWLSHFDYSVQYPNDTADWMYSYCETALPQFDYKRFEKWCREVKSLDAMLLSPSFCPSDEIKSIVPVVVNQQVYPHDHDFKALPSRDVSVVNSEQAQWRARANAEPPTNPVGVAPAHRANHRPTRPHFEAKVQRASAHKWVAKRPRQGGRTHHRNRAGGVKRG